MTPRRLIAGCFVLAALGALPRVAFASANYPTVVQKDWQLPGANPPDCKICHRTNAGGAGTATKFFSRSLQRSGLIEKDEGSLHKALAELKAANTDSDGDGVSDIDELQMGSDPNDGPGPLDEFPTPMTGCGVSAVKGRTSRQAATWLLALTGALLALRKHNRRPR